VRRRLLIIAVSLWLAPANAAPRYREVLDTYCVTCHNQRLKTAGLALDSLNLAAIPDKPEVWEKVVRKLRSGTMPPPVSNGPTRQLITT
jgi:mono/diheme cytochrome c family protein